MSDEDDVAEETGDEKASENAGRRLSKALESTGLIEVVEVNVGIGVVSVLGRVKKENEAAYLDQVADPALAIIQDKYNGWIGKQYFRKAGQPKGKRLRYGWVFSLTAQDIVEAASELCAAIETNRPVSEVMESPLLGPPPPQSSRTSGRKGVSPVRG